MTLTIKRETKDIFTVSGLAPYWSDGSPISARVAFNDSGKLSSMRAQSIDRANGTHYLLLQPIFFNQASILSAAGSLRIGESETVTL